MQIENVLKRFEKHENGEKRLYVILCHQTEKLFSEGDSPYPTVNYRRNGLRFLPNAFFPRQYSCENYDVLDLTQTMEKYPYEVVDKKKFFMARLRLGI